KLPRNSAHSLPTPPGISVEAAAHASSLVQSLTLRLYRSGQYQPPVNFRVPPPRASLVALVREWRLSGCPLDPPERRVRTCPPCVHLGVNELGPSSRCAEAVGSVQSEWQQLCHLVQMCLPLTRRSNWPPDTCLVSFGFPGLRIAYGPVRDEEGVPVWEMHMIQKAAAGQKPDIYINFVSRRPSAPNPHFPVREQLSKDFLRHHSVLHLLRQLASSYQALAPLACLAGGWHISPQLTCCRQTVLLAHPYRLQLEHRGRVTLSVRLDADNCVRLASPQLTPLQLIRLHPAARIDSDQSVALPAADWADLRPHHWLACACQFLALCQSCERQQQQRHELLDDGCLLTLRTERLGCLNVRLCLEGVLCHVDAGEPALATFVQRLLFHPPYRWQAVASLQALLCSPGALRACLCLEDPRLLPPPNKPLLTQLQLLTVKDYPSTQFYRLGMPAVGIYLLHDQRPELYFSLLLTDSESRRCLSIMILYDELKNDAKLFNPFAASGGGGLIAAALMRLDAEAIKPVQTACGGEGRECSLPHLFRAIASGRWIQ
uniref:CST complex subunit CTC1 n=1 Tax=Macrostomum lignano TaxID=282301 RepID=A0A1I8GFL2_9PLAT